MDTLGALALATEPPNDGLMQRPPIPKGVSFITKAMWRNIIGQSVYQLAVLAVLNFAGKQLLGLGGSDSTIVLNTLIFNSFVFCQVSSATLNLENLYATCKHMVVMLGLLFVFLQVFNEINSREIEKINIFRGMFSSRIFLGVMVSTVGFQVIIVELLGAFASTVPLSWELWGLSVLIGFVSMPVAVVLKLIPVHREEANTGHHDGYQPLPSGPELA